MSAFHIFLLLFASSFVCLLSFLFIIFCFVLNSIWDDDDDDDLNMLCSLEVF